MKKIICLLAIATLSACSNIPKYPTYMNDDAACLKGDNANFFKFFISGEAHVGIREIDGVPTGGGMGENCFRPGTHKIGYTVAGLQNAVDAVDLEFASGKKYLLRANISGISYLLQQVDISSESPVVVNEMKLKINAAPTPLSIPIFIPIRK